MWVRDRRLDFVATNLLGRALYAMMLDDPISGGNSARFTFLNPAARLFFPDWEENADAIVATLRMYSGRYPLDQRLTDLIEELRGKSEDFSDRWSQHEVRHHRTGLKRIRHPEVGLLEFTYQVMNLPANPDWFVFSFMPEAGSPTEEGLRLLGSLAATARKTSVDTKAR